MSITLRFLGFKPPPLLAAADYLIDRYRRRQTVDMSDAVVVTPGGRSGRRLLEILVQQAAEQKLVLTPPVIETVGGLPERLYVAQRPLAGPLIQHLAWAKVLRQRTSDALRPVFPYPPASDDFLAWLEIGRMLARQHTELAADGLSFSDVAKRLKRMNAGDEFQRWNVLKEVQADYLRLLDELQWWDAQTARMVAVERNECDTAKKIEIVGAVDMTNTLRQMLDQVAAYVTVLIFAPPAWADRFDQHGCLKPDAWSPVQVPVDTARLHLAEGPASQADRVARCLAGYGGEYRADEITIGLADETITPQIQRQLQQVGVASRSARGTPVTATAPCRLLEAAGEFLNEGRFGEFASLVRHADVHDWLGGRGFRADWLERLDDYHNTRLPTQIDKDPESEQSGEAMTKLFAAVNDWLEPLRSGPRPLTSWCEPIRTILREIYGTRVWDRERDGDRACLQAFEAINGVLAAFETEIPAALMPEATARESLRLLMDQLQPAMVAEPADPQAIELVGWLELPLDDAPAVIVSSFNEGYVPSSVNSDIFLPDALRRALGLVDNRRRYARDAYAACLLIETHDQVDLIVGRRTRDGDPLAPSRLLFAADAETIAQRAVAMFSPPRPDHELPPLSGGLTAGGNISGFTIPRPQPLPSPITELRVTAFKTYLACPYRFYLAHVLRLDTVDDAAEELDGSSFGTLMHDVLQVFGSSASAHSADPDEIRSVLERALDELAAARFPANPRAAIRIQLEQMRSRLQAFAGKQAEWVEQGWRIEHVESSGVEPSPAWLDVDGEPFGLRGRIDRIDRHRETGEWAVLDYKSSDNGTKPNAAHRRGRQWVDLQLPLYRYLAQGLGIAGPLRLGYILLPKATGDVQFSMAEWSAEELAAADDAAREVIRGIRSERFWPPADPPPVYSEAFAAICQDGVFERDVS